MNKEPRNHEEANRPSEVYSAVNDPVIRAIVMLSTALEVFPDDVYAPDWKEQLDHLREVSSLDAVSPAVEVAVSGHEASP